MDKITWFSVNKPLTPVGMIVQTHQRESMINRLLNLDEEWISHLRGSFNDTIIIVLGNEQYLPWIPGALYLGKAEDSVNLLSPTHLTPNIPIDCLDRAIQSTFGQGHFAINPMENCIYNISDALKINIDRVKELL